MTSVPILVFEDSHLSDSKELRESVNFPRKESAGGQDYIFDWHDTYNALGGIKSGEPVLIRSIEAYRDAVNFLRDRLSGEAIIFMDLQLFEPLSGREGGKPFNLTSDDITDDLLHFAACLDDQIQSQESFLEHFNPKRLGMLLALSAVLNPSWRGMILFASQRANIDLKTVGRCLSTGDRILWRDVGRSMSVGSTAQVRAEIINKAIKEFREQREGPPFWPAETDGWFKSITSTLPHDAPPHPANLRATDEVRKYLVQLLAGFAPPDSWFQPPQWAPMYEMLKGLIGAHSVSAGCTRNPKNLRLSAVPILLAAQMAFKKGDINWLKSFEWSVTGTVEIMAHENETDARAAIRAMAVFLEHLSFGDDGSSQVIGAKWGTGDQKKHLWLDFKIDPLRRTPERSLLQTLFGSRWGNSKGQTVTAYETSMERAKPEPSAGPSFSLCIYPKVNDDQQTITRLDFHALGE